jgi:NAD(P)-dependent dehydrogenase (short-subunit alcohol dehydrogenase family)
MQHIFITGTSAGLGHGLAQAYLDRGARVYGLSRRAISFDGDYHHIQADLGEPSTLPNALASLLQHVEALDVVVLNGAILGRIGDMSEVSVDDLERLMRVNVWANKAMLDWLFDTLTVRQVIGLSSGASIKGERGWGAYSISKAALNMLLKIYAHERPDCHFTALAPGLVASEMQESIKDLDDPRFPSLERLRAARGTEAMPSPADLGPRIAQIIADELQKHPSGGFVDIRKI